tara:strand:+ start:9178 stop:9810 length:633 start_codon:yes stop_codon:yes gene_type:complete
MAYMERKTLNLILWPVALILLNSLWSGISNNSAPYEINDYDHPIEERIITLGGVLGQDKPMPAVFDVEFQSLTDGGGSVEWNIFDENDVLIAQWSGDVSDEDPGWEGELKPGTYRFQTVSEQEIITEQTLFIEPFGAYVFEGHIALSSLLFFVAFAETFVRKKGGEYLEKKNAQNPPAQEKAPFSHSSTGMPEYDALTVEDDPWRTPKGL